MFVVSRHKKQNVYFHLKEASLEIMSHFLFFFLFQIMCEMSEHLVSKRDCPTEDERIRASHCESFRQPGHFSQ